MNDICPQCKSEKIKKQLNISQSFTPPTFAEYVYICETCCYFWFVRN